MHKDMTLKDIKVPPGGLLNPGLRHISVNVKNIKPMKTPPGHFKNVLGK